MSVHLCLGWSLALRTLGQKTSCRFSSSGCKTLWLYSVVVGVLQSVSIGHGCESHPLLCRARCRASRLKHNPYITIWRWRINHFANCAMACPPPAEGGPDLHTCFPACCSRTGIKQKRHKAHNAVMQCGFILIYEKLG